MKHKKQIYLFLIEGFEEGEAGIAVSELREAGLPVKVIGQTRQAVRGAHGLMVNTDLSLEQALLNCQNTTNLLIIGDRRWPYRISSDPRASRLVKTVANEGNPIVLSERISDLPPVWEEVPTHLIRRYTPDLELRQTMRDLFWDM
ncbi:MAG: DJ-1/PfpI family protein [Anaerolineae bacterium]